jgi:hypothetical protein
MRLDVTITSVPCMVHSDKHGNMCENDTPSLGKPGPCLALPAARDLARGIALEGYRDAGKVLAERDDLEPCDGARQVDRRTPFAKRLDFLNPIQCLGGPKPRDVGRGPEHANQGLDVVGNEGLFVTRIELAQLGYGGGVIDKHDG